MGNKGSGEKEFQRRYDIFIQEKPEVQIEIAALIDHDVAQYMTWTNEERNEALRVNKTRQSGTAKMKHMAEFMKIFQESDVDKNQLLNLEEWLLLCAMYTAVRKAHGEKEIKKTEKQREAFFHAYNKISPNEQGLSIWDVVIGIHFGKEVFGQKLQEGYEAQQVEFRNPAQSEQMNVQNMQEPDIEIFDLTSQ